MLQYQSTEGSGAVVWCVHCYWQHGVESAVWDCLVVICSRGPSLPEQAVVTSRAPMMHTETSQLTEDNEDFAGRGRYHQSEVVQGKHFDDDFQTDWDDAGVSLSSPVTCQVLPHERCQNDAQTVAPPSQTTWSRKSANGCRHLKPMSVSIVVRKLILFGGGISSFVITSYETFDEVLGWSPRCLLLFRFRLLFIVHSLTLQYLMCMLNPG